MADDSPARRPADGGADATDAGLVRRVFANAGKLLGGTAVAGALGLGMLALTARGLGAEAFGVLVLVHAYAKFVGGIVKFQSWQTVIRYGAACLEADRRGDLQGLLRFTGALDLAGGAAGVAVAALAAPAVGGWLGWEPEVVPLAAAYSLIILVTVKATPVGILRLFDRFDLLAAQAAVPGVVGFVGAAAVFAADGGLVAYLAVWFLAAAADGLSLIALGVRELARRGLLADMRWTLRGVAQPHPGLWRFAWTVNLYSGLFAASRRAAMLLIGVVAGPAGAGLYRVAEEVGKALNMPGALLRRSVYPEMAKLAARDDRAEMRRLLMRAGLIAGSAAAAAVLVVALGGLPALRLALGPDYAGAYGVMVLLAAAAAIRTYGVALEPVFFAAGRPGVLLRISAGTMAVRLALIVVLVEWIGLIGAGVAAVASTAATMGVAGTLALRWLASGRAVGDERRHPQGDGALH